MKSIRIAAAMLAACFTMAPGVQAQGTRGERAGATLPDIEIPHETFTLANGLRVVVSTDRKAPVVAVGVWYGVGSRDEHPGITGFAHLFEHLMFNGSEHFNDDYFKPFEQVGATDMNGTTWFDRTNYFQTVPTTALEMTLWMESDRMGHLLGVVDQARLDEQRARGQEREAPGRQPALRARRVQHARGAVPVGPSVQLVDHRLDGGSRRGLARRRARLVSAFLRRLERGAGAGRRHRRRDGAAAGGTLLRRHRAGPAGGAPRSGRADPRRQYARRAARSRAAGARLSLLGDPRAHDAGGATARARRGRAGFRQVLAPLRGAGGRAEGRDRGVRRRSRSTSSRASSRSP